MFAIDIKIFCFGASYAVAFALELLYLFRPRPIFRLVGNGFGCAGLLAHTYFILDKRLLLAEPYASLLFLAWILAVFYLYGAFHHNNVTWGVFVLPLVLALTILGSLSLRAQEIPRGFALEPLFSLRGERFWGQFHGTLVLLAGVGICVGFIASIMYLVQVHRLKAKVPPGRGMRMLSLERLENMNRRAIILAFPLLTVGLIVGVVLGIQGQSSFVNWTNPKLMSIVGLWVVFAILLYLRYASHARGQRVAVWTIIAFGLLVLSLVSPVHPFVSGGMP